MIVPSNLHERYLIARRSSTAVDWRPYSVSVRRARSRSDWPKHEAHRTSAKTGRGITSGWRELGTKYHAGAFRNGFATLKAGGDTVTAEHLLGRRHPSMVSRVYGHVQQGREAHCGDYPASEGAGWQDRP